MLSFVRPGSHDDFSTEAQRLLDDVRAAVMGRGGKPETVDFEKRDLWSGSWKSRGRHKKALAGLGRTSAKCAWCERIRDVSRELDVEHYRPKVKVTRWEGAPSLVSDRPPPEVVVGPGYWWLAFAWENYSLSCKECNSGWKRNLFPVREPRPACVEGVEGAERPLLLDPSMPFRVSDHFSWNVGGIMEGVSEEGRATIITCGLNRTTLTSQRVKLVPVVRGVLSDLLGALRGRNEQARRLSIGQLALLGSRDAEFAGMVRWLTERTLGHGWEEIEGLPD
jgi:hypothetical protein